MKLRQLSIHPQVYIGARKREPFGYSRDCWTGPSTKFSAMEKLLADEVKPRRWIIFCQFKDEMSLIENELMDKYTVLQYHGGLSEEQKATVLHDSEGDLGGKHMVFLVNIKSGGPQGGRDPQHRRSHATEGLREGGDARRYSCSRKSWESFHCRRECSDQCSLAVPTLALLHPTCPAHPL